MVLTAEAHEIHLENQNEAAIASDVERLLGTIDEPSEGTPVQNVRKEMSAATRAWLEGLQEKGAFPRSVTF